MNRYMVILCACLLLCGSAAHAGTLSNVGGAATDLENEKVIRKLYTDFAATWNRHDAAALGAMWALDGDHLEPDGRLAKGRKAVSELLIKQHETVFKDSILNLNIADVWFITADVALIDGGYEIVGIRMPDGSEIPKRAGHLTAILLKEQGRWWIAASRLMVPAALPYKKP
jgi:uncharacterized protein (TIGR02246 family)